MPDSTEIKAIENDVHTLIGDADKSTMNEIHNLLHEAKLKLGGDLKLLKGWIIDKISEL